MRDTRETMIGGRLIKVSISIWLLGLAQLGAQPPRIDGRGERDWLYFDALREAHHELSPNRELLDLLWHDTVRKEIGLSVENYQEIQELRREGFKAVMDLREELKGKQFDKAALVHEILESQRPVDERIFELLGNPDHANFERLIGIYVQSYGPRAATNAMVAQRIGLVGDEFAAFRKARGEIWHQLMDENRDHVGKLIREEERKKIARLFEEAGKKLDLALAARLTAEQRSQLQLLEGEQIDLPKQGRGPPRGRRGDTQRNPPQDNCCHDSETDTKPSSPSNFDQPGVAVRQ